jgi:hypothetical protein
MPSLASRVRRLNFCEWVDAESPWISGSVWLAGQREFDAVDAGSATQGPHASGSDQTSGVLVAWRDGSGVAVACAVARAVALASALAAALADADGVGDASADTVAAALSDADDGAVGAPVGTGAGVGGALASEEGVARDAEADALLDAEGDAVHVEDADADALPDAVSDDAAVSPRASASGRSSASATRWTRAMDSMGNSRQRGLALEAWNDRCFRACELCGPRTMYAAHAPCDNG